MKQNPGHLHGFCVLNIYCGLNIICDDSIEFAELVVKVDPFCGVLRIEWPVDVYYSGSILVTQINDDHMAIFRLEILWGHSLIT